MELKLLLLSISVRIIVSWLNRKLYLYSIINKFFVRLRPPLRFHVVNWSFCPLKLIIKVLVLFKGRVTQINNSEIIFALMYPKYYFYISLITLQLSNWNNFLKILGLKERKKERTVQKNGKVLWPHLAEVVLTNILDSLFRKN